MACLSQFDMATTAAKPDRDVRKKSRRNLNRINVVYYTDTISYFIQRIRDTVCL